MALDKNALRDALVAAFEQGLDDPEWSKEDAAQAMADAVDAYVRGAEVTGVETQVVDGGGVEIGTGSQVGTGTLQ